MKHRSSFDDTSFDDRGVGLFQVLVKLAEKVADVRHGYFPLFERDVLRSERLETFVSALDFIGGATWWWRTSRWVFVNDILGRWVYRTLIHSHESLWLDVGRDRHRLTSDSLQQTCED